MDVSFAVLERGRGAAAKARLDRSKAGSGCPAGSVQGRVGRLDRSKAGVAAPPRVPRGNSVGACQQSNAAKISSARRRHRTLRAKREGARATAGVAAKWAARLVARHRCRDGARVAWQTWTRYAETARTRVEKLARIARRLRERSTARAWRGWLVTTAVARTRLDAKDAAEALQNAAAAALAACDGGVIAESDDSVRDALDRVVLASRTRSRAHAEAVASLEASLEAAAAARAFDVDRLEAKLEAAAVSACETAEETATERADAARRAERLKNDADRHRRERQAWAATLAETKRALAHERDTRDAAASRDAERAAKDRETLDAARRGEKEARRDLERRRGEWSQRRAAAVDAVRAGDAAFSAAADAERRASARSRDVAEDLAVSRHAQDALRVPVRR